MKKEIVSTWIKKKERELVYWVLKVFLNLTLTQKLIKKIDVIFADFVILVN